MDSVEVKSIDSEAVRRATDAWAHRLLGDHPEIEEIVVFGSFARGTYAPGSDLDALIVLAQSNKAFRDRIPEYLPDAFPVGLDLLPFTRDEIGESVPEGLLAEVRGSRWRYLRPGRSSALGRDGESSA
ncbi:MAG: nucleotidyltransferase domain-containing protein [Candidatus Krumholzibacteriia bacterium]